MVDISFKRPLPTRLEQFALTYWWLIVAINIAGTVFGFFYYRVQFSLEPTVMLPFVPDSPTATLFFAVSLGLWAYGRDNAYLNSLAFLGCWKLGLWTPYVLLMFADDALAFTPFPLYVFLIISHLGMAVQALLMPAYGTMTLRGLAAGVVWYVFNDIVDYFIPIVGTPHHTVLPAQQVTGGVIQHVEPVHTIAAIGALFFTVTGIAVFIWFSEAT